MTREQYEEQKRRLAEQHRSLVEMVDSAYQSQLRALDMVWRMMSGEGPAGPHPAPAPPAAPPQPAVPVPPARRRRRAGELYEEVRAALARLPDLFTFTASAGNSATIRIAALCTGLSRSCKTWATLPFTPAARGPGRRDTAISCRASRNRVRDSALFFCHPALRSRD